jgi:hypothetical protein
MEYAVSNLDIRVNQGDWDDWDMWYALGDENT